MRGRFSELLDQHETEESGDEDKEEALEFVRELLVETAVRCDALGTISAFPRARATFISLVRGSTFPCGHRPYAAHDEAPRSWTATAAYLVMSAAAPAAPAAPAIVMRRQSELLPLAVAQLVEAGDIIGAGMLVLYATTTHASVATSFSAAIVALQAYFVGLQLVADSDSSASESRVACGESSISGAVQRRCEDAYKRLFE